MIVTLAAVSVALIVVLGFWYRTSTRSLLAQHARKKAIVTLKSGESFSGVLFAVAPDAIVLRDATMLAVGATSEHLTVDGEVLVLRADVAYVQFA